MSAQIRVPKKIYEKKQMKKRFVFPGPLPRQQMICSPDKKTLPRGELINSIRFYIMFCIRTPELTLISKTAVINQRADCSHTMYEVGPLLINNHRKCFADIRINKIKNPKKKVLGGVVWYGQLIPALLLLQVLPVQRSPLRSLHRRQ